jgi:excisionase family DNA binding protein
MTIEQAKILSQFIFKFAQLANDTLMAYVEKEEKSISITTFNKQPVDSEKRLLNKKELAERLGVSVRTISSLQKEGLPTVQFGKKRVQFNYDKVLAWLEREVEISRKTKLCVVK